jgi:hypothetical protein
MWQVENHTPFGALGTFVRDRNGAEVWLVAVKASYLLDPDGGIRIAEATEPRLSPLYLGEPGKSSLSYDTDFPLTKPATDVVLHAHAYARRDGPVAEMAVRMCVGPLQKTVNVTGHRFWEKRLLGMRLSPPIPFNEMPLTWENAFGGVDRSAPEDVGRRFAANPVGTGYARRRKDLLHGKAPTITYPDGDRNRPAGFGPIPADWLPRAAYGGTYDEHWAAGKAPLLPDDLDERFFCCAPPDQQVPGHLKGGETVELYGMTPDGTLAFKLPALKLTFRTVLAGRVETHAATLHTVILEPDLPGFSMVWHTALGCQNREHRLEKTVIT